MTTYSVAGVSFVLDGGGSVVSSFTPGTVFEVVTNESVSSFSYTTTLSNPNQLDEVNVNYSAFNVRINGTDILDLNGGTLPDAEFGKITWDNGGGLKTSYVLVLSEAATSINHFVVVGGDAVPDFVDAAAFSSFRSNDIVSMGGASSGSGFGPGELISYTSVPGVAVTQDDTIYAYPAGGSIDGGSGNDEITGNTGDDLLKGGSGNDELIGAEGNDVAIFSGNISDYLFLRNADGSTTVTQVRNGDDGTDQIVGVETFQFADNSVQDWQIYGHTLFGSANADTLTPPADYYRISALGGDDTITIPDGIAEVEVAGNAGNDTITGASSPGADSADEFLTIDYTHDRFFGGTLGVQADLITGTVVDPYGDTDTVSNVDRIYGTNFADSIIGDANFQILDPHGGVDFINGGGGNDELAYHLSKGVGGSGHIVVTFSTTTAGSGTVLDPFGDTDTFENIGAIRATENDDTLNGGLGSQRFRGLDGADVMDGGADDDTADYIRDAAYGGLDGIVANLETVDGSGFAQIIDGFGKSDLVKSIERIRGTDAADSIIGNAEDNYFEGEAGGDTIEARGGNDRIFGGRGDDVLRGEVGNDKLHGGADDDILEGGDGSDELFGDDGNDTLNPGDNSDYDYIQGSSGNDQIVYSLSVNGFQSLSYAYSGFAAGIASVINGIANTASVNKGANGTDTITDIVNPLNAGFVNGGFGLSGTDHADSFDLTLNASQWMSVSGGRGADSITVQGGSLGPVQLDYRGGDNGVNVNLATGVVSNDGFGDVDTLSGTFWEVRGTDHADMVVGSSANESFIGRAGDDHIDGGDGFDRIRFDRSDITGGVTVNLAAGAASGTWNEIAFSYTLLNIEEVHGTTTGDDTIRGSSGVNDLRGLGGNDTFIGGLGDDMLDGGEGNDTADYSAQTSAIAVDLNLAAGQVSGGSIGADTLMSIETIVTGSGDDTLTGDAGNNRLFGGAGFDSLIGGAGNDMLDGGANPITQGDILLGGLGNDIYIVDSALDLVDEGIVFGGAADGVDEIISKSDFYWDFYSAGDVLRIAEDAVDDGDDGTTGVGSVFSNFIVGNSGTNILFGRGGSDTYMAGDGIDFMSLSTLGLNDANAYAGVDGVNTVIVEQRTTGPMSYDIIFEFEAGKDKINVADYASVNGLASGTDVVARAIDDGAGNSYIALGDGLDYVYMVGLEKADLQAGDFVVA